MSHSYLRCLILLLCLVVTYGCSSYQPAKEMWKTTRGLWNTYVSPPAVIDYENKGDLPPESLALSKAMMGVDTQLGKLEKTMHNADKPPTQEWLDKLFASFSWLNGFAGIRYDGQILGQQPENSMKDLDFNYLLYEDQKQNSRALRADVQPSPLGPEIMLASPLYDGVDFLGIVVAYFDFRNLMQFSENPDDIVVLCPTALLWSGKYDFAATPLAGVDWAKVVRESTAGTCTNSNGSFFYMVRYLGNLPLVFAIPQSGTFPENNGGIEQGYAFFPKEREKMAPPPVPESMKKREELRAARAQQEAQQEQERQEAEAQAEAEAQKQAAENRAASNEIQPGSRDSMLLKRGRPSGGRHIQERQLEGENVPFERPRRTQPARDEKPIELIPERNLKALPGNRLSPFGPDEETVEEREEAKPYQRPSPFGPRTDETAPKTTEQAAPQEAEQEKPEAASGAGGQEEQANPPPVSKQQDTAPAVESGSTDEEPLADGEKPDADKTPGPARMPDGRPSPFGPR